MNRYGHFDGLARLLHWGMAVMIVAMLFVGAGVEEQSASPAMIVAGMPASPAQMSVLSPRIKRLASAASEREAR